MTEKQLEQAFNTLDKARKGYLTLAEYKPYAEYIVTIFKISEAEVSILTNYATTAEKVSFADVKRILITEPTLTFMQQYAHPGAKIIETLKQLYAIPEMDESSKAEIQWAIEKILEGKLYETELKAPRQKDKMLPWLETFSTPQLCLETVEAYQKTRKRFKPRTIAGGRLRKSPSLRILFAETKLVEQNSALMATLDSSNFDIMKIASIFGRERTMEIVAYQVFRAHKAFNKIDEAAFEDFITKIRKGYEDNEYHNDLHAADVLQVCHYMLLNGLQETAQLDSLDVNALLISAIVHDYKHPGVNNGYLQNSGSDLALLYNDQSVLENYHVSQTFKLIWRDPDCNIFKKFTKEEAKIIRKRIIQCVVHTDGAKHFELLADIENLISAFDIKAGKNAEKIINSSSALKEFESKQKILNVCMHAADISNPTRPFSIAYDTARRLLEEFYNQGDMEKMKGLPITSLCDRSAGVLPRAQVGFVGGIAKPYFQKLVEIFPGFMPMMLNLRYAEQEWIKKNKELNI